MQRKGTAWELSGLAESCPWLSEITTGLVLALLPAPVSAGTLWVQHPGSKPSLTAFPTCLGQLGQKIPPVSIPAWACVTLCAPETTLQAQGGLVCCQNSWLLFSWSILDARGGLAGMGRAVQEPWTSAWPHFPELLALSLQAVQQSQHPSLGFGVEGTSEPNQCHPCRGQGHFPLFQDAPSSPSLALDTAGGETQPVCGQCVLGQAGMVCGTGAVIRQCRAGFNEC